MRYNGVNYSNNYDCNICGKNDSKGMTLKIQEDCEGQIRFEFVRVCSSCTELYLKYKAGTSDMEYSDREDCKFLDKILELEKIFVEYQDKLNIIKDELETRYSYYQVNDWKKRYEETH